MWFQLALLFCCAYSTTCLESTSQTRCFGNQPCPVRPEKTSKILDSIPQLNCSDDHRRCLEPNMDSSHLNFDCRCWENCVSYGDCCYNVSGSETASPRTRRNYRCINPLPTGYETVSYFMETRCPLSWKDQEIKQLCTSINLTNPYQTMPVTSLESYMTYRNIYCAACNEDIKNITSWIVEYSVQNCTFFKEATLGQILQKSEIIRYTPPPNGIPIKYRFLAVRFCSPNFRSRCPSHTERDTRLNCKKYFAPVVAGTGKSNILYKNEFCASCNGHAISSLECVDYESIINAANNRSVGTLSRSSGCYNGNPREGQTTILEFDKLIDIDFSRSSDTAAFKCGDGYTPVKWRLGGDDATRSDFKCVKSWNKKRRAHS